MIPKSRILLHLCKLSNGCNHIILDKGMKIMSETRLTIEQIIAAVNQLKSDEMAILDKHLSQLRRERMRELTK